MVGFSGVLKSDCQQKCILILGEERPFLHCIDYISTILKNHSENSNTSHVQVASFIHRNLPNYDNVVYYDFIQDTFQDLGKFYSTLTNNIQPHKRNVLLFDDLSLFYIYNERKSKDITRFFQQILKTFSQVVLFCTVGTLRRQEISLLCTLVDILVVLKNPDDDNLIEFGCSQLTIKPSGKTSLDMSYFEVVQGQIKENPRKVSQTAHKSATNSDDIMRSLTTFKLTIEEDEKESKSQLYLPYLDAQRVTVPDPSEDFYDDDEDDEDDEF